MSKAKEYIVVKYDQFPYILVHLCGGKKGGRYLLADTGFGFQEDSVLAVLNQQVGEQLCDAIASAKQNYRAAEKALRFGLLEELRRQSPVFKGQERLWVGSRTAEGDRKPWLIRDAAPASRP